MRFALYGGDRRYACAAEWLRRNGEQAHICYEPVDCERADCVVLPTAPEEAEGRRVARFAREGALLLVQRGSPVEGAFSKSLDEDEAYLDAVARLTSEGAVFGVLGHRERAIFGARCVVFGYGRIGRSLTDILRALRANVTVAVRNGSSALRAAADDAPRCGVEEAETALREADFVWNTVPARVLPGNRLAVIPKGALLFDLASAPYGFDILEARAHGVSAERLPGLPGKYCPESAGEQLALAALRAVGRDRE